MGKVLFGLFVCGALMWAVYEWYKAIQLAMEVDASPFSVINKKKQHGD